MEEVGVGPRKAGPLFSTAERSIGMGQQKGIPFPEKGTAEEFFNKLITQPAPVDPVQPVETLSSHRTVDYKGHSCEITTQYTIKIDGKLFTGQLKVNDEGQLYCNSLPYADYGSVVEFIKSLIDIYPEAFAETATSKEDASED